MRNVSQLVNMAPDKFIGFAGLIRFARRCSGRMEKAFEELKLSGLKFPSG